MECAFSLRRIAAGVKSLRLIFPLHWTNVKGGRKLLTRSCGENPSVVNGSTTSYGSIWKWHRLVVVAASIDWYPRAVLACFRLITRRPSTLSPARWTRPSKLAKLANCVITRLGHARDKFWTWVIRKRRNKRPFVWRQKPWWKRASSCYKKCVVLFFGAIRRRRKHNLIVSYKLTKRRLGDLLEAQRKLLVKSRNECENPI